MNSQEQRDTFFQQLSSTGWQDAYAQSAPSMQYPGAVDDLVNALEAYWQKNPTLASFSVQINGVMALDLSEEDRTDFVTKMNRLYLQAQNELPETLADCYDELVFWDLCPMKSAISHFQKVGDRFCEILKEHPSITPEVKSIILNDNPSPQMQKVADEVISVLRESIRGQIAVQVSPAARLDSFLLYATGECGAHLISDSMWKAALKTSIQSAHIGGASYIQTRQTIISATNTQILDSPRLVLDHLANFIAQLDESVHYGRNFQPDVMLPYWRSMSFQPIPDDELLALYAAFLKGFPNASSLIKQDFTLLKTSGHQHIIPQIKDMLEHGPSKAFSHPSGGLHKDGLHDRFSKEKHASEAQSSRRFIWGGLILVGILLIIVILLQFNRDATPTTDESPSPSVSDLVETNAASSIPEETEAPAEDTPEPTKESRKEEATPKATEQPSPTPEPTVEATAEPAVVADTSEPEPEIEEPIVTEEVTPNPDEDVIVIGE